MSRLAAGLAIALTAGCTDGAVPEANLSVRRVGETAVLFVRELPIEGDVRWGLHDKPAGSDAVLVNAHATAVEIVPDVPGIYVVDRWLTVGVAEDWTHRFVLDVSPSAPRADAGGDRVVDVGETVTLDGSASVDPDGGDLEFSWRMAGRPRDSAAVLANAREPSTTFVADREGDYVVELSVFDGHAWSDTPDSVTIDAR